jgi:hypothetical protein
MKELETLRSGILGEELFRKPSPQFQVFFFLKMLLHIALPSGPRIRKQKISFEF